jgi:hypothetical protein
MNQQIPAWNDQQIARFKFREALFQRRGLDAASAEKLGDRLAVRDHERDDRRCCLECESFQFNTRSGAACFKRHPVSTQQLVRCPGFTFLKP